MVDGQPFDVYFHDIVACVWALVGDPELSQHIRTAQEHHYLDADETMQRYSEVYTSNWLSSTQVSICLHCSFIDSINVNIDIPG